MAIGEGARDRDNLAGITEAIAGRLESIRLKIDSTCSECSRRASDIRIVAVAKGQPMIAIAAARQLGLIDIGESYLQEARSKQEAVDSHKDVRWHFIGHLQRNKAAQAACRFALVQSVDSVALAQALSDRAQRSGCVQDVLVQVRLGEEETKYGIDPNDCKMLCDYVRGLGGLRLCGLMGIGSRPENGPSSSRSEFNLIGRLFKELDTECRRILSIGMSADFVDAIREGSTMLRLGTALFGSRN